MTYYISRFSFTYNIFFSKDKAIMVMFVTFVVVVLTFMVMFVTFVVVVLTFMVMFVTFVVVVI